MKISELLNRVEHISVNGATGFIVNGLACDSRYVRPGYMFIAISGYQQDGWNFVGSAIERGATVIVSEHSIDDCRKIAGCDAITRKNICFVQVADSKLALAELSSAFYGNPSESLEMIGITGTNGKTTTAYLIDEILKVAGKQPGMLTTVQYDIGQRSIPAVRTTPEAPVLHNLLSQMLKVGCRSAVMEVSSHSIVQKRVAGIDFDVAIFTNLTHDHLDYHKTMEEYFEAKAGLFRDLGPDVQDCRSTEKKFSMDKKGCTVLPFEGEKKLTWEKNDGLVRETHGRQDFRSAVAVINIDDEWGRKLAVDPEIRAKIITYGIADDADIKASDITVTPDGCSFQVETSVGSAELHIKLLGRFNVSNALAALGAGISLGIDLSVVVRALSQAECVAGRLEVIRVGNGSQVFVDYAHTDDALMNVLQTLREITKGKLFVVFGCGGDRDVSKRPAMGKVAEDFADYSILTSDNPRTEEPGKIIREIADGFNNSEKYEIIEDRKQAIIRAISLAGDNDVVLVAGKGHENFQVFGNKTMAFDDRQVVRDVLGGGV